MSFLNPAAVNLNIAGNSETVWHVLLACTSTAARKELKIFSYLASALNRYDPQKIAGIKSYAEFMALLM